MSSASFSNGRFTAGQNDGIITPRIQRASPVFVWCHSLAGDAFEASGQSGFPAVNRILSNIADHGYTIVCPTQPFESYGNGAASPAPGDPTAQGRIHDAITYARANLGCTNAPIVIGGMSQGSTAALRFAMLNPTLVACVFTVLTVCDLTDSYVNDWGGTQASIGPAYGVTYPTALPSTADPYHNTGLLAGVPGMLHHSTDDTYSVGLGSDQPIAGFCAATGMTEVPVGALGHTNASAAATDDNAVISFIRAHT